MAEFKEILRVERVDESGNVLQAEDIDLRRGIVGEAAPTENTPGMAGLPYYVVRDGKITAEYVCVAAEDGVYTWKKKESGTGSGTVDDTLTVPGAAADAKAVGDKVAELSEAKADLNTVPNRAVMQGNTMKFQRSTVSNGATTTKNLFEVQIPTGGSSEGGTADGGGDGSLFPYIWKKYKGDPNTITYTDGSGALYIAKRGYPTGNRTTVYYSDEINTGMGGISLADPVQIDIPVTQDGATTAAVLKGKYVTLGSNKDIYFIPEDARIIMAGSAPMYDIRATTYQTVEGAEFLGFVTAETSDAYPANGVDSTDGCWYVGGGLIADLTDINAAVDVDDTLTVSGAAADAAEVGKKFTEVSKAIADKITAPATATVGQTIVVSEVDENGKPTAWEAANIPELGGDSDGTDIALGISGAAVGQIARITAVDDDGMPTAWEAVELPSGGMQLLIDYTTTAETLNPEIQKIEFTQGDDGNALEVKNILIRVVGTVINATDTDSTIRIAINNQTIVIACYCLPVNSEVCIYYMATVDATGRAGIVYRNASKNSINEVVIGAGAESINKITFTGNNYNKTHLAAGANIKVWGW